MQEIAKQAQIMARRILLVVVYHHKAEEEIAHPTPVEPDEGEDDVAAETQETAVTPSAQGSGASPMTSQARQTGAS